MGEYICEDGFLSLAKCSLFVYASHRKMKNTILQPTGSSFDLHKKHSRQIAAVDALDAHWDRNRKRKEEIESDLNFNYFDFNHF